MFSLYFSPNQERGRVPAHNWTRLHVQLHDVVDRVEKASAGKLSKGMHDRDGRRQKQVFQAANSPLSVGPLPVENLRSLKVPEDLRIGTLAAEKDMANISWLALL